MKITKIFVDGFKNLRDISFSPSPDYNLILGENAQGKTNLLESLWIFTGCRSFRGTKERDYFSFSGVSLKINLEFYDGRRIQSLNCTGNINSSKEKKFFRNDIPISKTSELFEVFHCVNFTPDDISLINGSPEVRRNFIDYCLSQLYPPALSLVRRYQILLAQKNALLRQRRMPSESILNMLGIWDRQIAQVGSEIALRRSEYIKHLSDKCGELYKKISSGREDVSFTYHSNIYGKNPVFPKKLSQEIIGEYYSKLESSRNDDIQTGFTTTGIQRDDLKIKINDMNAREFGSQGQKKSLALALKLAQAQIYYDKRHASPIILLDDVMGELDSRRQHVVSTMIDGMQVFITACSDSALIPEMKGLKIYLDDGKLNRS